MELNACKGRFNERFANSRPEDERTRSEPCREEPDGE